MSKILFSFQGKLNRAVFFKYSVILVILAFLCTVFFGARINNLFYGPGGIVGLIFVWMWLALFIKRGNDIGIWWPVTAVLAILFNIFTWIAFLIIKKI